MDVVTVLEYKEVSVGIKLQMSKDRREMASDAIGQTIGYGMSILNAQPWRSEVYLLLTNFKDATVVQVYREADVWYPSFFDRCLILCTGHPVLKHLLCHSGQRPTPLA